MRGGEPLDPSFCIEGSFPWQYSCDNLFQLTERESVPLAGNFRGSLYRIEAQSEGAHGWATHVLTDTKSSWYIDAQSRRLEKVDGAELASDVARTHLGDFSFFDFKLRFSSPGRSRYRGRC